MLLFQGFGVTASLFVNQGQVKLRNIHQLKSLGEISCILLLTLNSVVTKAIGKTYMVVIFYLLRAQYGKAKVIDQSNDLPVFLVYFSYESLRRGNYYQNLVIDKKVNKRVFYASSTFMLGKIFPSKKLSFQGTLSVLLFFLLLN